MVLKRSVCWWLSILRMFQWKLSSWHWWRSGCLWKEETIKQSYLHMWIICKNNCCIHLLWSMGYTYNNLFTRTLALCHFCIVLSVKGFPKTMVSVLRIYPRYFAMNLLQFLATKKKVFCLLSIKSLNFTWFENNFFLIHHLREPQRCGIFYVLAVTEKHTQKEEISNIPEEQIRIIEMNTLMK